MLMINKNVPLLKRFKPFNTWYLYTSLLYVSIGILVLSSIRFPPRIANPLFFYLILLVILYSPFIGKRITIRWLNRTLTTFFLICGSSLILFMGALNFHFSNLYSSQKQYMIESKEKILSLNGQNTVFVQLGANTYTQWVNPLKEFNGVPKYNELPFGWTIGSPFYYEFLNKFGATNGKEFIDNSIDNDNVVFYFYEMEVFKFEEYKEIFEKYLNNHHSIKNKKITLQMFYDDRFSTNFSYVYFKLVTE